MNYLDFDTYKVRKCCKNIEMIIKSYDDAWIENGKLNVRIEFGDDDDYSEFELEECPECGQAIILYQNVDARKKYCAKSLKICYAAGKCNYGHEIKRIINEKFIEFKKEGIKRIPGIVGFTYVCEFNEI